MNSARAACSVLSSMTGPYARLPVPVAENGERCLDEEVEELLGPLGVDGCPREVRLGVARLERARFEVADREHSARQLPGLREPAGDEVLVFSGRSSNRAQAWVIV